MTQDNYKFYRAVEKRLYNHRSEAARLAVLTTERKEILCRILPSVGVAQYGEHIGRASDTLTGPEQQAESGLRDNGRLWQINREADVIEARQHALSYALAILTNKERDIIKMRYFDNMPMGRTAEYCQYSDSQCHRIRQTAIRRIGEVLFGD